MGYDDPQTSFDFALEANCTNSFACNYNTDSVSDEDCIYPAFGYGCDGACLNDSDQDGVCDEFELLGCTNPAACNFNEAATEEDGSCTAPDECGVCGGIGIPEGDCDCNGNQLDILGVCGGNCTKISMPMAFVTTSTTAWVRTTSAASATVLAPSTNAVALTSRRRLRLRRKPTRRLGRVRR